MIVPADMLASTLAAFLVPFVRIAAAVSVLPVFGNRVVPVRAKLALAVALTLAIAPLLEGAPVPDPASAAGVLLLTKEVLVGLAFGFALRLAILVMELTGQLVAHLMGLGFAALVDPANGVDVPALSQLYILLATLVFLGLDGHLVVVATLVESFTVIPVVASSLDYSALWHLTGGAGWVFAAAVKLALPAMVTLLIVNLAFGVISRAAPQLNIIVLGFPMSLAFGFVVIWFTYSTVVGQLPGVFELSFEALDGLLGDLR